MKKVISILIATVLALSSIVTAFAVPLNNKQESNDINGFINGITELVREYDADKEFTVSENDELSQIQDPSAPNTDAETNEVRANTFAASAYEGTENSDTDKYTLLDFQTARLIVRANGKFNKFGALEDVSGFEDFHILQYESPEEAMEAYANLQVEKNVTNIALDEVVTPLQGEKVKTLSTSEIEEKDYLCDWSVDRTQSKRLQKYLETENIPMQEVIVGVVDDGVHYDHEFLKGRIYPTGFNSSTSGKEGDEYGSPDGHGTAVCSVIVDNTPENVKIRCYRVINDDGSATIMQMCAGYFQAIKDGVDVINSSLAYYDSSGLTTECVEKAYIKSISIFGAVGNDGWQDYSLLPANSPKCISVSATDANNTTTDWTTLTDRSDISAPGENIKVAVLENKYTLWSGTSFSTPCATALGAILKSIYPNMTVDQMDTRLKVTSLNVKKHSTHESVQGSSMNNYYSLLDGVGMIQFCNALGLERLATPAINLEDKVYVGTQTCIITCSAEDATILYTTDGTYPALENASVYTEEFQITHRTRIRAVAYYADGGYYSDEVEATPRIQYTDSDNNFVIDKNGIIKKYNGTISDLYVPATINQITVKGFVRDAFNNTVIGLTLPQNVNEIPQKAFYQDSVLEFIRGDGILTIGDAAFELSNIINVEFSNAIEIGKFSFRYARNFSCGNFSNVETIGYQAFAHSKIINFDGPTVKSLNSVAFMDCNRLERICLPQCTEIIKKNAATFGEFKEDYYLMIAEMPLVENLLNNTFEDSRIIKADFPFVKTIGSSAFYNCDALEHINMPSLLFIPNKAFSGTVIDYITDYRFFRLDNVTQISSNAFGAYPTARVEFSHLESAKSLPQTENCIIAMPSTFKKCNEKTIGRNYKVYGTKGTEAEKWANENGHEFIEISQETAILQDVPMEYTDTTQILSPDVIGFNRTYQWYGSFTADNTAGAPIDGATDKDFNPTDYPAYPYYYCVVTSTDVGYDPIEIRTGVTANKMASADYSAYDAAVLKANALEREYYKDLTALDAALAVDVSGLFIADQAIVDAQTKAIEDALTALELKDADYSAYNAAVEKAKSLDKSLYTDTTELNKLLAEDISGLTILDQDIVDNQTRAIEEALKNLVLKSADYTEYNKAVEQAKSLDRSLYEDLTAVDEALAVDVSGKNITEQADVDNQTQKILNAISGLAYKSADYKEYYKAVEQAQAINRDLYEDLTALDDALAVDVSGKNITEQTEVDAQTQTILDAINGLVEKEFPTEPTEPEEPSTVPIEPENPEIPNTGGSNSIIISASLVMLSFSIAVLQSPIDRKRK